MNRVNFSCPYCPAKLAKNKSLRVHVRRFHPLCEQPPPLIKGRKQTRVFEVKDYVCSICSEIFTNPYKLLVHRRSHGVKKRQMKPVIKGSFASVEEFISWKNAEEDSLICRYHIYHSHTSTKKTIKYYQCHRNGFYRQKGKGKRHLKSQGSCKSGRCFASIAAHHYPNGTVSIIYYNKHSNHDYDPAHITLHKEEKERLAKLVGSGMSFDDIISKTHYRLGTEDNFHIKFLTKHDLHNIVRSFNIPKSELHANDVDLKNDFLDGDDAAILNNLLDLGNNGVSNGANIGSARSALMRVNKTVKRQRGRKANIAECRKIIDEINKNIENIDMRSVVLVKNLLKQCQGVVNASLQKAKSSLPKLNYTVDKITRHLVKTQDIQPYTTNQQLLNQFNSQQSVAALNYFVPQHGQDFMTYNQCTRELEWPTANAYTNVQISDVELANLVMAPQLDKANSNPKQNNRAKKPTPIRTAPINIVPKPEGFQTQIRLIAVNNHGDMNTDLPIGSSDHINNLFYTDKNMKPDNVASKPKSIVTIPKQSNKRSDTLTDDTSHAATSKKQLSIIKPLTTITLANTLSNNQMYLNSFAQPNDLVSVEISDTGTGHDFSGGQFAELQRFESTNNSNLYTSYNFL